VKGGRISRGLPDMLSVAPIIGRTFTADEMLRNARDVAVISEALWKRRFGGTRDVIGRQLQFSDGWQYEIVGVMPNRFSAYEGYQREAQVWFPLRPDTTSQIRDVNAIARLRADVTVETANAELALLAAGAKADDHMPGKWSPQVMTPDAFLEGTTRTGLPILFLAVAAVLLIGCANIAGLLLVRLNYRRREIAIRAAVGARRATIIRLLAIESLLLALLGGALGVAVATWITIAIRTVRPANLNSLDTIRLDGPALLFALAISLATALFFGIAPAVTAWRRDLTAGLLAGSTAGGRVTSGNRIRSIMVGGQIALSLILLVASLLLVRSIRHLQEKDLGFDASNVLTLRLQSPQSSNGRADAAASARIAALVSTLRRIPGVTSVSISTSVPSRGGVMFGEVTVPGLQLTPEQKTSLLGYTGVSPDYIRTIGLRLKEGRFLHEKEDGNPADINASWAKSYWPGTTAVGRQFRIGTGEPFTIVGVVEDVATMGPASISPRPHLYTPLTETFSDPTVALRTDGRDAGSITADVRAAVRTADPNLLMRDVATLEALMADTIALDRFYVLLLSSFAALALLLSAIGLYGVISNAVAQRTREIGVRIALGASPGEVLRMVFGQSIRIVFIGLACGAAAAMYTVKFLGAALHGFSAYDPLSYTVAVAVLTAGALMATWIPARRAVRVDPMHALRGE
jgi:putative ABC transport system permease protein